jgi:radical SAM protein with 4Fe4S-binding SPASM domain
VLATPVLSAPVYFSLELTPACNNRCPGCGNVFVHQPAALSADAWGRILDMLRPHVRTLKFTGGEPTLHPEFAEIIRLTDGLGIPFTVFTNARWRHPERIITLLTSVQHLGGLLVSLHGADAPTYEAFSGVCGSFAEACENIRRATANGLRVHTSTVLNAYNIHQLEQIVEFSRSLGSKRVVFNRFLGRSDSSYQPTRFDLKQAIQQIEHLCQIYPARKDGSFGVRYGNCIPQCFAESSSSGCWAGVAYCTIDPWGCLRPCNHSPTIIGNLFEHPLEMLWHSEAMQRWRSLTPQACFDCGAYEQCHGSCRALIELEGTASDPLMTLPLQPDDRTCEVKLYRYAKPTLACEILPAQTGWVLFRGLSILPVLEDALPILNTLDGETTLQELYNVHGQECVDFVGELLRRGYARCM